MTRTTKALKANKASIGANENDAIMKVIRGRESLNTKINPAKKEMGFQKSLERMELAVRQNKFELAPLIARAASQLTSLNANFKELIRLCSLENVKPVGNLETLKKIYATDLQHLNEKAFIDQGELDAKRFMERSRGVITEAQETIIKAYHIGKARASMLVVDSVYNYLADRGAVKIAAKEAPKVEQVIEKEPAIKE